MRIPKFTREQVKILAANPFTSMVDFRHIWYTEEFMNLFLERYKNGETSFEIFASCGYDTAVLGENRIYGFPRRARRLLGNSQVHTGTVEKNEGTSGQQDIDHNTEPTRQSVSDMQRELEYLRRQVQLLKQNTEAKGVEGLSPPNTH